MDDDRKNGMGIVVEYANKTGPPRWIKPVKKPWDYTIFGDSRQIPAPDEVIPLVFGKINGFSSVPVRLLALGMVWLAVRGRRTPFRDPLVLGVPLGAAIAAVRLSVLVGRPDPAPRIPSFLAPPSQIPAGGIGSSPDGQQGSTMRK